MNRIQKAFWIFAIIIVFTMIGDRLLFILFPIYLIQKNFSATEIGLIFSLAASVLIVLRTFIGRLSDKYGRKKIMSFGLLVEAIVIPFYPAISKFYQFTLVKMLQEIGTTLRMSIKYSLQADSFPKNLRAKHLAKLGTFLPLGRTIAMILGFLIVTYLSFTIGFYFAALSFFIAFLIFTIFYKENRIRKKKPKIKIRYSSKFKSIVFGGFIQSLCYRLSFFPAFFILANVYLHISTDLLFLLLLIDYIIAIPVIHFLGNRIDKFGRERSFFFGFLFMGIFTVLFAFVLNVLQFLVVLICLSLSYFIWRISFKIVVMDSTHSRIRGEQLGFSGTLEGVGDILGPVVSGLLIDLFFIQAPFLVAGFLLLTTSLILYLKRF